MSSEEAGVEAGGEERRDRSVVAPLCPQEGKEVTCVARPFQIPQIDRGIVIERQRVMVPIAGVDAVAEGDGRFMFDDAAVKAEFPHIDVLRALRLVRQLEGKASTTCERRKRPPVFGVVTCDKHDFRHACIALRRKEPNAGIDEDRSGLVIERLTGRLPVGDFTRRVAGHGRFGRHRHKDGGSRNTGRNGDNRQGGRGAEADNYGESLHQCFHFLSASMRFKI